MTPRCQLTCLINTTITCMARRRNRNRASKHDLFADTSFWLAVPSARDQYHDRALRWQRWIDDQPVNVITTEAVLWEWLNGASAPALRGYAARGYRLCHRERRIEVVPFEGAEMQEAFSLYESHTDKAWSLTDCLSFVVTRKRGLTRALTADRHFQQAGFQALLLKDPPS